MDPLSMMIQFAPTSGFTSDKVLGYKLRLEPICHQRFRNALFQIAELHHRRRTHGMGGGVLLIGPSGAGKSTILEAYEAEYPRSFEEQREYSHEYRHTFAPQCRQSVAFQNRHPIAFQSQHRLAS